MSTSRIRIAAAAFSIVGWVAVLPVGVANADCTTAGDFGAGAGCAPPGGSSGSGKAESWPPTSVDWPPQLGSDSDSDSGDKAEVVATSIVDTDRHARRPEAPAGHTLVRFGFDKHLDTAQADRPGGLGVPSSVADDERDPDPDRHSARLALSPCAEFGPRRYLTHG